MTLQQEAYSKIDQLSDDGIRALIDMIDTIRFMSVSGFRKTTEEQAADSDKDKESQKSAEIEQFPARAVVALPEEDPVTKQMRAEKKKEFMLSAGKIDIDEDAIRLFRERSMV